MSSVAFDNVTKRFDSVEAARIHGASSWTTL